MRSAGCSSQGFRMFQDDSSLVQKLPAAWMRWVQQDIRLDLRSNPAQEMLGRNWIVIASLTGHAHKELKCDKSDDAKII